MIDREWSKGNADGFQVGYDAGYDAGYKRAGDEAKRSIRITRAANRL